MVIKVRDIIGTRYIINSLSGAFRNAVVDALEQGITLDLAGCRLGPTNNIILEKYIGQVKFINSEEPELNEILENNYKIRNTVYEEYPELVFPKIDGEFDFLNYFANLPTGKYSVELFTATTNNYTITLSMICLVLLCRPDIELDLSKCSYSVIDRLRKDLNIESFIDAGYTDFLKCYTPVICMTHSTDKDFSYTDEVIPAEIGSKVIFDIANSKIVSGLYEQLVKSLLNDLIANINNIGDDVYIRLVDMLRYKEDADDDY